MNDEPHVVLFTGRKRKQIQPDRQWANVLAGGKAGADESQIIHHAKSNRHAWPTASEPRSFLEAVLAEVNRPVPSKGELRILRKGFKQAAWRRRQVEGATRREAEFIVGIPDGIAAWAAGNRSELAKLLRDLAQRGELPAEKLKEQVKVAREGLSFGVDAGVHGSRPFLKAVPMFSSLESMMAFAVVRLAEQGDVVPRVVECKQCGKLFLEERGGQRGRPRSSFCCKAHGNLYRVLKHQRQKATQSARVAPTPARKAARKHKK